MNATFRLRGVEELQAVLRRLPQRMQDRVYDGAVRGGAQAFRRAVRARTPVGADEPHPKYGRGRANIRATRDRERPRHSPRYIVHTGRAFWLMFYEFGTRHQPARPFFRPAFDESPQAVLKGMTRALGAGLAREARKLAGEYRVARRALGVRR